VSRLIGVMHITDTLVAGGAERVAVNLVNFLPRERYRPYLCTTRSDGPLDSLVASDVKRLRLRRKQRFDFTAIRELVLFVRRQRIRILHCHGTSLFIGAVASCFCRDVALIWHDHFGRYATEARAAWLYSIPARRLSGIIAVNEALAEWSKARLGFAADQVAYIPNFVDMGNAQELMQTLPGQKGQIIVCVANFRPQKDHPTLLRAMKRVVEEFPAVKLLLVGDRSDEAYLHRVQAQIVEQRLAHNVSVLGPREDVAAILAASDIGVLSSSSEGLPLALIEYGMAGLPAVATMTGQCPEVMDNGKAGMLVPTGAADELANALLCLLRSPELREELGQRFNEAVREHYSAKRIIGEVSDFYDRALTAKLETVRVG
jgi:glycosyltransferase involved in cell wall biosynthesis